MKNHRCILCLGKEPLIWIPRDSNQDGSVEQRACRAVHWLWSRGIYPGVAAVSLRLHGRTRRNLNDREIKGRNLAMAELAIPHQRRRQGLSPVARRLAELPG